MDSSEPVTANVRDVSMEPDEVIYAIQESALNTAQQKALIDLYTVLLGGAPMKYDEKCSCGHKRRQHSYNGCSNADPQTGKMCDCKETYMNQNPAFDKSKNRKGHA